MPDPSLSSLDPDAVPVAWQGELIAYGRGFGRKGTTLSQNLR